MVREFSIIDGAMIINRILATEEFMESLGVEYTDDETAHIGCYLHEGQWVKPTPEE